MTYVEAVEKLTVGQAEDIAKSYYLRQKKVWDASVATVFRASICPTLAPTIKGVDEYAVIQKWCDRYSNARESPPSKRFLSEPKTKDDPLLFDIISAIGFDASASEVLATHKMIMSIENRMGLLIEEYLSQSLPNYGWHCAWGESVRSVDFVSESGRKLQVKSRNNSENSSSCKVREGRGIELWWRFNATTGKTNWQSIRSITGCSTLNDESFREFACDSIKWKKGA